MNIADEIKLLRENMGMNRKEFCEYFAIPYRTVVDWEYGRRKMPEYLLGLMEYKVHTESLLKELKKDNNFHERTDVID